VRVEIQLRESRLAAQPLWEVEKDEQAGDRENQQEQEYRQVKVLNLLMAAQEEVDYSQHQEECEGHPPGHNLELLELSQD